MEHLKLKNKENLGIKSINLETRDTWINNQMHNLKMRYSSWILIEKIV